MSLLSNLLLASPNFHNSLPIQHPPQPQPRPIHIPNVAPIQPQLQINNQLETPSMPSQNIVSPTTPSTANSSGTRHTPKSMLKLYEYYGINREEQSYSSTSNIDLLHDDSSIVP